MRPLTTLLLILVLSLHMEAQSNKTVRFLDGSHAVVKAMYETRDSAVLTKFFAPEFRLQQPDGNTLGKAEAIHWLVQHPSKFVQADMRPGFGISENNDTSLVRHFYKGREYKADGSSAPYAVNLVMAWLQVKRKPLLYRLQLIKVD